MVYNTKVIKGTPPMTTAFAEFAAQQDAKNTIYLNIVKYGLMLCDALLTGITTLWILLVVSITKSSCTLVIAAIASTLSLIRRLVKFSNLLASKRLLRVLATMFSLSPPVKRCLSVVIGQVVTSTCADPRQGLDKSVRPLV
jgi:hypothetical protein